MEKSRDKTSRFNTLHQGINPSIKATQKKDTPYTRQVASLLLLGIITLLMIGLIIVLLNPRGTSWKLGGSKTAEAPVVRRVDLATEKTSPVPSFQSKEQIVEAIIEAPPLEDPIEAVPKTVQREEYRSVPIYFLKVNTSGQILLKSSIRRIDFANAPLSQSINTLILGPDAEEINKDSISLIPQGTRLLSARIEDGTAYLNFNEAFRFNQLGREGSLAQLKQIVYTATEFSSIQRVQILIEGSVKDYLGGEGFYIGSPLERSSF